MQIKRSTFLLVSLAVIGIFVLNLGMTANLNADLKQKNGIPKGADYSGYDKYDYYVYQKQYCSYGDYIDWSFSSSNPPVGITVIAMNSYNFGLFSNNQSCNYVTLSDGSHYSDSGTFYPQSTDTWYIVFFNYDSVQEETYLTETTTYYPASTPSSITVTTPNDFSSWKVGNFYYIKWTSTGNINYVDIDLYKDGNYYSSLLGHTSNSGSYLWSPTSNIPSGDYTIKVYDSDDNSIYDYSDTFYIENPIPLIIIISIVIIAAIGVVTFILVKKKKKNDSTSKSEKKKLKQELKQEQLRLKRIREEQIRKEKLREEQIRKEKLREEQIRRDKEREARKKLVQRYNNQLQQISPLVEAGSFKEALEKLTQIKNETSQQNLHEIVRKVQNIYNETLMLDQFYQLIRISEELKIDDICAKLKKSRVEMMDIFVDWADKFGIRIKGDSIVIENNDKAGSMASDLLKRTFNTWMENEKTKEGKKY